ncbi:SulP family inorganic anion transporter [Streptomyces sp. NPDC006997]|uniref:bifunctional SulP family inorganic anion transporter/carbonic anhydrase n=1 Tax=Streptomyces sp. NPDC006997 TaxID=3155356 RepID=UPI0033FC5A43
MSACAPTHRTVDDSQQSKPVRQSHSPPPARRRRFHVAGADVSASIAVFLIALPLSLGIALATGAPLQAGLVAAAVGGLVAGRLGGSPLQVSGPAAGLTVVTADIIQRYGWRTTCAITVLAGLAQLGLGCLRVARGALAVSPAIVHGMLAGIGVTIAVAQLHIVLGGTPQSSVPDNLAALPAQLAELQPSSIVVSTLTLALLLLWPRIPGRAGRLLRKVPAALIAVAGATAAASLAGLRLPKVDLPTWSSHALAGMPEGPVLGIVTAVITTTLVCSVQSLLGAVAVDKLAATREAAHRTADQQTRQARPTEAASHQTSSARKATADPPTPDQPAVREPSADPRGTTPRVGRSNLDRELLGQGAANIVAGSLGGLPVAGVAVRSTANVHAGAVSRNSTMLHGVLVVVAALLMVPILELIPLASLAALVMSVGIQMVSLHHIRTVTRHREVLVYIVTILGVVLLGVLEGVALGIAAAVGVALHRLTRTRITHEVREGVHHVQVRGQLTFLAVPRLSRTLHHVPHGADAVVELDGSFMDHAAYETLQDWQNTHTAQGGSVELTGRRAGTQTAEPLASPAPGAERSGVTGQTPVADCRCRPWTPWRNHQCEVVPPSAPPAPSASSEGAPTGASTPPGDPSEDSSETAGAGRHQESDIERKERQEAPGRPDATTTAKTPTHGTSSTYGTCGTYGTQASPVDLNPGGGPAAHNGSGDGSGGRHLLRGITAFQRNTAPHVRGELARLAREGQRPVQLFLTCADSRVVTSMITSSGPGDLFVVRNVGNLVPLPGEESGDDSVAAAIEYAVDVLKVRSITVCGHSGCGAMQALLNSGAGNTRTPLGRWLRHGLPSLERMADDRGTWARLAVRRPADAVEQLCLTNVVQQLEHLRTHPSVARALRENGLELHGMYFHVGEAQAYLLSEVEDGEHVFDHVEGVDELRSPA